MKFEIHAVRFHKKRGINILDIHFTLYALNLIGFIFPGVIVQKFFTLSGKLCLQVR